jgi:hypothetical protein
MMRLTYTLLPLLTLLLVTSLGMCISECYNLVFLPTNHTYPT